MSSASASRLRLLARGTCLTRDRRLHDVLDGGHVREQVEALEDHADLGALAGDFLRLHLVQDVAPSAGSP